MKHMVPAHVDALSGFLEASGIEVAVDVRETLVAYLDAVIETNLTLNLTRIADPIAGLRLHLLDSLSVMSEVDSAPPGTLLDIGTGGGFPGVPLCLASGRSGVLLDSVGKKAAAVNRILHDTGAGSTVIAVHERAEEHALAHSAEYSVVTARAVSDLPALVELASPLLRLGGLLIAFKGAPEQSELLRGRSVAEQCGMREVSIRSLCLAGGDERRCVVVYERYGRSRVRLPRRAGEAQRTPLA